MQQLMKHLTDSMSAAEFSGHRQRSRLGSSGDRPSLHDMFPQHAVIDPDHQGRAHGQPGHQHDLDDAEQEQGVAEVAAPQRQPGDHQERRVPQAGHQPAEGHTQRRLPRGG